MCRNGSEIGLGRAISAHLLRADRQPTAELSPTAPSRRWRSCSSPPPPCTVHRAPTADLSRAGQQAMGRAATPVAVANSTRPSASSPRMPTRSGAGYYHRSRTAGQAHHFVPPVVDEEHVFGCGRQHASAGRVQLDPRLAGAASNEGSTIQASASAPTGTRTHSECAETLALIDPSAWIVLAPRDMTVEVNVLDRSPSTATTPEPSGSGDELVRRPTDGNGAQHLERRRVEHEDRPGRSPPRSRRR